MKNRGERNRESGGWGRASAGVFFLKKLYVRCDQKGSVKSVCVGQNRRIASLRRNRVEECHGVGKMVVDRFQISMVLERESVRSV